MLDRTNVGAVEYELHRDPSVDGLSVFEDPRKLVPVVPSRALCGSSVRGSHHTRRLRGRATHDIRVVNRHSHRIV